VRYDYDIVYVRAPRPAGKAVSRWAEVGDPRTMDPRADLVLLHPNGSEGVLVAVKPHESIADPFVSFDGQWVYYAKMHDALKHKGSDIYKVHVPSRKIVQLTTQKFTPNLGAADWSKTPLPSWGVYNLGPTPVPGGKIAFVSDRNAGARHGLHGLLREGEAPAEPEATGYSCEIEYFAGSRLGRSLALPCRLQTMSCTPVTPSRGPTPATLRKPWPCSFLSWTIQSRRSPRERGRGEGNQC